MIKVQYECGNYFGASEYLYFHRILVQSTDVNYLNGMWGKLASEILMQSWETALEDFNRFWLICYFSSLEMFLYKIIIIDWKFQVHFLQWFKFFRLIPCILDICLANWRLLFRLRQFIDESVFGSSLQTLQQRTWLIHWSLFVFFNHPKVDLFFLWLVLAFLIWLP